MATSGSYSANSVTYGFMFINWQLASQETVNNRSLINWQAYFHFQGSDSQLDNGVVNSNVGNLWTNGGRVYNFAGNYTTRDLGLASGSFWVNHDSAGNGVVQLGIGITSQFSPARSEGTSGIWGLPNIPRYATMTGASNTITDETTNVYISYSNPYGGNVSADLYVRPLGSTGGFTNFAHRASYGSGANFNLTSTEINAALAALSGATQGQLLYRITNGVGQTDFGWGNEVQFNVVNANPVFTTATYRDSNSTTSTITGNDQYLIQGYSTLEMAILSANKATAQKQASMVKYNSAVSSISIDTTYTTSNIAQALGVLNVASNASLVISAIDSRGNTTPVTKTINVLPYAAPVVIATARRTNNFETATTFHIEGTISRLTIASVDKNAVNTSTGVAYRYKKTTDGTWGSWTNKTSATSGANISVTDFSVNLDRNYSWNVEVRIVDKLTTSTLALVVPIGTPIFRISTYDNLVYNNEQPIMTSHIGMVIMSTALTTAAAVAAIYGGTWVAWGTGRTPVGVDTGQTEFNTVEKTGGTKTETLTANQMPTHSHAYQTQTEYVGHGWTGSYGALRANAPAYTTWDERTDSQGGGQAHNNLAPYITTYMWKRTV